MPRDCCTCFMCHAFVAEGDGADVVLRFRVKGTEPWTTQTAACCDDCADQLEAHGARRLDEVPALTSITATYEDGTSVRRTREEA